MSDTIFQQTPVEPQPVSQPQVATIPPEIAEFVGDGKKYKSVDEALRSVPHAQAHISKLEQEMADMKAELQARKTTEQLLEEVKSGITQPTGTPSSVSVDPDKIAQLVNQTLEQREAQRTASQNIGVVTNTFVTAFGSEQAEQVFIRLAQENGLTVPQLNTLAATSPAAVLKLAGLDKKPSTPTGKLQSTVNTDALKNTQQSEVSARVQGKTTKDLVNAWRNAGLKVQQNQS